MYVAQFIYLLILIRKWQNFHISQIGRKQPVIQYTKYIYNNKNSNGKIMVLQGPKFKQKYVKSLDFLRILKLTR